MKNILVYIFIYLGGGGSWGTLTSNPGLPNFQGSKTSSQSRQMYNKKKNYRQFVSYMGPNVKKCVYLAIVFIFGGGGGSWGTLTSNPGLPNFQGSKTSSQSRQMYNKKKN